MEESYKQIEDYVGAKKWPNEKNNAWFNQFGYISAILSNFNLDGLNYLIHARRIAKQQGFDLVDMYILGHWWLDGFAQCHVVVWDLFDKRSKIRYQALDLPLVEDRAGLMRFLRNNDLGESLLAFTIQYPMPSHAKCSVCGLAWNLGDAHTATQIRSMEKVDLSVYSGMSLSEAVEAISKAIHAEIVIQPEAMIFNSKLTDDPDEILLLYPEAGIDGEWIESINAEDYIIRSGDHSLLNIWRYRHPECHSKYLEEQERRYFLNIFRRAGYDVLDVGISENQYWPDPEGHAPWFYIYTNIGVFHIGWRKRVISIQWDYEVLSSFDQAFSSEGVTLGKDFIHAWGEEKCVEYLKTILQLHQERNN